LEDPEVEEAMAQVVEAGRRHGIATGLHPGSMSVCLKWRDRGMTFLPCGGDVGMILTQARSYVEEFRRHGEDR
jgi:2-keto-3-deoxy-L-rhamnonate aldolase RhmA